MNSLTKATGVSNTIKTSPGFNSLVPVPVPFADSFFSTSPLLHNSTRDTGNN